MLPKGLDYPTAPSHPAMNPTSHTDGARLATEAHLCREGLSKRLNETLSLLLEGKSEKEAANQLGLSARTVHDYVTTLYQHFRVCSRAELLAYFIRRQPAPRAAPGAGAALSARSPAFP